jgi:hypothetical protein
MTSDQQSHLKGVRGWLLFLCVILTFLTPLSLLAAIGKGEAFADSIRARFPAYATIVTMSEFANFGFFCYSINVGVSLWRTKKGAVIKAQTFLIAYVAFAVLRVFMPYLGDLTVDIRGKIVDIYIWNSFRVFIPVVIWHQYLARSVRVKDTFSG